MSTLQAAESLGEPVSVPRVPRVLEGLPPLPIWQLACRAVSYGGGQSGGQLETCPREAEAREGGEVTATNLPLHLRINVTPTDTQRQRPF